MLIEGSGFLSSMTTAKGMRFSDKTRVEGTKQVGNRCSKAAHIACLTTAPCTEAAHHLYRHLCKVAKPTGSSAWGAKARQPPSVIHETIASLVSHAKLFKQRILDHANRIALISINYFILTNLISGGELLGKDTEQGLFDFPRGARQERG
jgi:hypothetical protein